jgi:cytochrome b
MVLLGAIMVVWGCITLGFSVSWGSMEAFENLFGETGISIEEYTQSIDQIFTLLALFFLLLESYF